MVSILIRFGTDTDPEPLIEFMRHEEVWRNAVREIQILDDERPSVLLSRVEEAKRHLSINIRGGVRLLEQAEIGCLEKVKRSILVHMIDNTSYMFYGKFEDIMSSLNGEFCRCHKSYIVNMELAEELRRYEVLLKNGACIPVSQKRYNSVRETFYAYGESKRMIKKMV